MSSAAADAATSCHRSAVLPGFLDVIRRDYGEDDDAGDEHGGATGDPGRGLPDGSAGSFMFATGIECSNPTIDNGSIRRDLLEGTGHYRHWREDLLEAFGRITIVPHGEFLDVTERPAKLRFTI